MVNISDLTAYYIATTYLPELQKDILESFSLLEAFGLKYYEDKYIELIQRKDSITSDTKQDQFLIYLQSDISRIIEDHDIHINYDETPTLEELNEIAHFLYIIQNLENYEYVSYRVHSDSTPRLIIIDLIEYYTLLKRHRVMQLISSVSDKLIEALKAYTEDKIHTTTFLDQSHLKHIYYFFKFTENHPSLGLTYFNQGYRNTTLEELLNLIDLEVDLYIDELIDTKLNLPQAALDVLSLLILSKDTYEIPLLKFKQNVHLFTIDILLGLKSEDSSYDARLFASANQLASARFLLHRGV